MNALLAIAASTIADRKSQFHSLRTEWDKVDPCRIAALTDLEDCFFQDGIRTLGLTGQGYLLNDDEIEDELQNRIDNGMFLLDIPGNLAKEKTEKILISRVAGRLVARETQGEFFDSDMLSSAFSDEINEESKRLQAMYIGDWLDVVNSVIMLRARMAVDIVFGNSDKALQIVRNLQQLEDYSEFNTHRRPPGGSSKSGTQFDKPVLQPSLRPA